MNIVKINESIFREYDIRGIYNKDIDIDVSYTIGRSFGSYIKEVYNVTDVIIGHDNRISSPDISKALLEGLKQSGANVIDLGLCTTPMYYFAKKKYKVNTGIMVTASHNPKEYNGFKISFDLSGNAYGQMIRDFRDYTNKGVFNSLKGTSKDMNIEDEYLACINDGINLGDRKVKVVVDCGNGTGSIVIRKALEMFNIDYKLLYAVSDPEFPNHQPDPAVIDNQRDLSKTVVELGYDFGFGIDGDADRVGIVDNKGNILAADIYLDLIYRSIAKTMKNKKAIYDVKCSKTLIDDLDKLGLEHTMYRTGNSYMNMKINKDDYDFGGEFSGHVWFRDKFPGFDDGIYAGLRVVELLSKTDKNITDLLEGLNKYYSTTEIKIHVTEDTKFKIVEEVKKYCDNKGYKYNDIDGVRTIFDDSWALVRASNTGPDLTVRFEASTEDRLKEINDEFMNIINK